MKIKNLFALLLTACVAVACSSEDDFWGFKSSSKGYVLTASVDNATPNTRVGFTESGTFYWSKGDKLGVTSDNNASAFDVYTLDDASAGEESGTFTGSASSAPAGYAVYPYNTAHKISGTSLTYNLPAAYIYTQVDQDFFTATQGEGNSFNAPMWGAVESGNIALKHLGGVFCVKVKSMPAESGSFVLSAGSKINGDFSVDLSADTPVLATSVSSADDTKVTITYSGATENSPGVFYVPVPTGTYTGVTFTVNSGDAINGSANYTINRCTLKKVEIGNYTINGEQASTKSSVEEAETELQTKNAVEITDQLSSETTITIPAKSTSDTSTSTEATKSVIVSNVAENTTIKLATATSTSDDASTTSTAVENVTLALPNTTAESNLKAEVSTPTSSTTIEAIEGSTVITELTAETADNTLKIGKGVDIQKLTVKKGNIEILEGGKISISIARAADFVGTGKTTITIKKGASLDIDVDAEKFEVIDENKGESKVTVESVQQFLNGETSGVTVLKLNQDLSLTEPLVASASDITLDLNGHSITPAGTLAMAVIGETTTTSNDALIIVRKGAKLTIEDSSSDKSGLVDAKEIVMCAVKLTLKEDETTLKESTATLVVNGGTFKGNDYAISGNGTRNNTDITINGGKFTTYTDSECAIYQPQYGKLVIKDGEIIGATAVEVRSGEVDIQGGTLEGTATFSSTKNGNGATSKGVALAIAQHSTKQAIDVIVKAGTFKGEYAIHESNVQGNGADDINKVALSVTGGTFEAPIYSEDVSNFITGGTFSDLPSALAYATKGTITISKDQSVETLDFDNATDLTVDLNQKVVTVANPSIITLAEASDKLTIKNGEISNKDAYSANKAFIDLEVGDFTLNDVDIITTKYGCGLWGQQSTVNLTVTGGTLTGAYFSYSSNALTSNSVLVYGSGAKASFTNTVFSSPETGFMMNVPVTFTFEGCTFSGNHQGALLRGGTYIFNGDKNALTLKAELPSTHSECHNTSAWKSGNQAAFAALVIGNNQESTAYQYPTSVTFNGTTTVKTEGTYASSFPEVYVTANSSTNNVTITGAAKLTNGTTAPQVEYYTENITVDGEAITKTEDSTDDAQ
jgi:hypothetical protein